MAAHWKGLALEFRISLLISMVTVLKAETTAGEVQEFCQNERFRATCDSNEVIVMEEANYGRMRQGRCIKKNYGFIGCHADVLDIGDVICSGRHVCSIRIPNELLDAAKTECPEDFKSYFEAKHTCVKVATPRHGACRDGDRVVLTEPEGIIANVVTSETRCGSAQAPWRIKVKPGQHLSLTLLDFSYTSNAILGDECIAFASIKEISTKRSPTTVCGGKKQRTSTVYVSLGNEIQIIIFGTGSDDNAKYFLLKYTAIGCPDPSEIQNGWFKREGNTLEVGCNDSPEKYIANCNGTKWNKDIKNCSVSAASRATNGNPLNFSMSYEIAIVIILAIALVIASTILCVGVICMKRIRDERSRQVQQRMYADRSHYLAQSSIQDTRKDTHPPCLASYEQYRTGENLYASIQENVLFPCSNECRLPYNELCTCKNELLRESRDLGRDRLTGNGPYSSLEQPCAGAGSVALEPMSPTSRSECSSIFPEAGRPYYVLDQRDELDCN